MARFLVAGLVMTLAACGTKTAGPQSGANVAMIRDAEVGAAYGSAGPRSCGDRKTPSEGPLTVAQATAYVICGVEHQLGNELELVAGITVAEVSPGRPYNDFQDNNLPDIDTTRPVQAIRGKLLKYTCWKIMPAEGDYLPKYRKGTNCSATDHADAKGLCYQNTMGQWSCNLYDFNARTNFRNDLPPPA